MARARQVSPTAEGKHIGHACEGHARALCRQLFAGGGREVLRAFPFDAPVNPDVVVREPGGAIRLVVIVAYWRNARNSDSKFYRTRLEYQYTFLARRTHPERFAPDFKVLTLLYGAPGGWKKKVLEDLRLQCPPLIYLPERLDSGMLRQVIEDVWGVYRDRWETQGEAAREHVEDVFAEMNPLPPGHRDLLELLRAEIDRAPPTFSAAAPPSAVARVPAPFQTRYRQGLSLLSVFPDREIRAWAARPDAFKPPPPPDLEGFIRRAVFLDLATLEVTEQQTILRPEPVHCCAALARRPHRLAPFDPGPVLPVEYAPARPDFRSWEEIDLETVVSVLAEHRANAALASQVFRGGAQEQVIGNYREIGGSWLEALPLVREAVDAGDADVLADILKQGPAVEAEAWHPARGRARLLPVWDLGVCLCAVVRRERKEWKRRGLRRQQAPAPEEARTLAVEVLSLDRPRVQELLDELLPFAEAVCRGTLLDLAGAPRPALLSLDDPCSWLSGYYNNITTNSTHNPLCVLALRWLRARYPGVTGRGWPAKRSARVSRLIPTHPARREWQFLGQLPEGGVVAAEVKSITANNWGNKSKEIYDRVWQTRCGAAQAGVAVTCLGILDGDFLDADGRLEELRSGIGYDETYSIREVLDELLQGREDR